MIRLKKAHIQNIKIIYICFTDEDTLVISLLNEGFYIYDNNKKRVLEMKTILSTPILNLKF